VGGSGRGAGPGVGGRGPAHRRRAASPRRAAPALALSPPGPPPPPLPSSLPVSVWRDGVGRRQGEKPHEGHQAPGERPRHRSAGRPRRAAPRHRPATAPAPCATVRGAASLAVASLSTLAPCHLTTVAQARRTSKWARNAYAHTFIAGDASLVVLWCCSAADDTDDTGNGAGCGTIGADSETMAFVQATPKPADPTCDPSSLVQQWRFLFGAGSVASQVV